MAINRLSKYEFAISQSISGSFAKGDTVEASFIAKGNTTTANQYATQFVDIQYSVSSQSISLQQFPKGTYPEQFYISNTYATKSFVAGIPEEIQYIQFTLTGSLDGSGSNTYNSGGAANYQRAFQLDYDAFQLKVHRPKTELTDSGLLVFTSPSKYIKADSDGIEIKGGEIEAEKVTTQTLEVFGDTTIFGDVTATANSPYDDTPQNISTTGAPGESSLFARGDHVHNLPFATLDAVAQEGDFTNISGSKTSTGSFAKVFAADRLAVGTNTDTQGWAELYVQGEGLFSSVLTSDNALRVRDSGTDVIRLESSGHITASGDISGSGTGSFTGGGIFGSRVGIGTTTPTHTLTVEGDISASGTLRTSRILDADDDAAASNLSIDAQAVLNIGTSQADEINIGRQSSNNVDINLYSDSSTPSLRINERTVKFNHPITASTNVYIDGELSASGELFAKGATFIDDVTIYSGSQTNNPRLSVGRSSNQNLNFSVDDRIAKIYHKQDESTGIHTIKIGNQSPASSHETHFITSGSSGETTNMFISSSGNVGIGTTTPSTLLHISDTTGANTLEAIRVQNSNGYAEFGAQSTYARIYAQGVQTYAANTAASYFYIGGSVAATLNSTGLGINTTIPSANLEVSGSQTISGSAGAGSATTLLNVGGLGNGRMLVRHIEGKDHDSATLDQLHLNYTSTAITSINRGGGNVGIGTTTPSKTLTVVGDISSSGDLFVNKSIFFGNNVGDYASDAMISSSGEVLQISDNSNVDIIIDKNGSATNGVFAVKAHTGQNTKFMVSSSGNVGIGTTSPVANLDIRDGHIKVGEANIYASDVDQPYLIVADDDYYTGETTSWGTYGMQHRIKVDSGGVPRLTIDSKHGELFAVGHGGNVGIGTDSPGEKLEVAGNISASSKIYGNLFDFQLSSDQRRFKSNGTAGVALHDPDSGWAMKYGFLGNDGRDLGGFGGYGAASLTNFYIGHNYTKPVMTIQSGSTTAVGIGRYSNTTPPSTLTVEGSISASDDLVLHKANGVTIDLKSNSGDSFVRFTDTDSSNKFSLGWENTNGLFAISTGSGLTDNEAFVIETNGKVGIGTSSPQNLVDIHGGMLNITSSEASHSGHGNSSGQAPSGNWQKVLRLGDDDGDNGFTTLIDDGGTSQYSLYTNRYGVKYWWHRGSDGDGIQNVALLRGHDTDQHFDLYDGLTNTAAVRLVATGSKSTYFNYGNVGIGTTSPSEMLHLKSTGDVVIKLEADSDNTTETDNPILLLTQDDGGVSGSFSLDQNNYLVMQNYYNNNDGDILFKTKTNSERMRIKGSGEVGIGTTTPSAKLDVSGDISASGDVFGNDVRVEKYLIFKDFDDDANYNDAIISRDGYLTTWNAGLYVGNLANGGETYHSTEPGYLVVENDAYFGNHITASGKISSSARGLFKQVGIGTSPANNVALDVRGDMLLTGHDLYFSHDGGTDANNDYIHFSDATWQSAGGVISLHADQARGQSSGSVGMGLFTDGMYSKANVGIGTDQPKELLHIAGTTDPTLVIQNTGANQADSGKISFREASATTERMNIRYDGADNLLIIDGETYSNQFVVQKNSPGNVGIGTASPSEKLHINDGNLMVDGNVTSPSFTSGFAGSGYRIETGSAGTSAFTIDNLTVRGTMSVYELMIHQIRATNGSLFVANTGKITSASLNGNAYSMSMDTGSGYGHSFQVGDLIRAQRFVPSTNGSGSQVFKSDLHVISVEGTGSIVGVLTGSDVPQPGYEYVRIGSISDTERQGSIYLTADDGNAPFIDVVDELTAHSQFNTAGKTKVRMGKLSGITSPTFGTLPGYGFYASGSAFLEGSINATNGEIGGFTINSTAISASNLFMKSSGQITGSDVLFDGGTIGGWDITETRISSGNVFFDSSGKINAGTLTGVGNQGSTNTGFRVNESGEVLIKQGGANSNYIRFDNGNLDIVTDAFELLDGNLEISGTLSSSVGNIGGFTIDADEIKSDNLKLNSSDESLQLGTVSSSQNSSGTTKGLYASGSGYFFVGAEDGDFIKFNESDGTIAISSSDLKVEVGDLQITASDIDMTATEFNLNANSGDLLLDSVNHQVSLANGNIVLDGTDTGYLKIGGSVAFDTFNNTTKGILAQGDGDILIKGQVPNQYIQFKDGELDISTQKATISGSDVNILTPKIFLGQNNSNFISASEGNIEISSSNFHLQANGDLTASSVLFDGGTIEGPLKINNDVEIGGFNGFTTIFFDDFSQYANVPALTGSGNNPKTDGTGQGYFYFSGNGEVSLESGEGAIFGNKVIKLGNDSGNDQVWFSSNQLIPFNSQSLYEMEIRIKKEESDDDGSEYFGISGYAADGTTAVNIQGSDSLSSQHYFTLAGENVPNDNEWRIYKGYFKGHQNNVSSPGNKHATITDPGYMSTGSGNDGNKVMYFAPMFLTNYSGKDGTAYIDYIKVSEFNSNGGSKISGDNIQTGKITSNNLSTTAGSEFNLQDGTFKLGGTDNPDLSFDGTTLQVSGTLSSSIGNIGGWKIEATKLSKDDIVLDSIGKSIRLGTKQSLSDANAGIIMSASTGMAIGPEGTGFIARNDGRVTGSNVLFDGGKIGGFEITSTHISASDGGILISGSGEGELANGNITFDKFGNIDITDARLRISKNGFPLDAFNAATGKFIDLIHNKGNVNIVAFEDNTIVTRISASGEIRDTLTLSASQVSTNMSDRKAGDVYDANKPIYAHNSNGMPLAPLSATGKEFVTRINRDNPAHFHIYSPYGDAEVGIFSGSSGGFEYTQVNFIASQSLTVTQSGFTQPADTTEFYKITSSLPIVVSRFASTAGTSHSDYVYIPPASKEILFNGELGGRTIKTDSSQTITNTGNAYYLSDKPFGVSYSGDGDGTDGEMGLPIEMLGDTYIVPHTIDDYRIVALESGVIKVYYVNNGEKTLYETYDVSGSKATPQEIKTGSVAGGGGNLFTAQSVRFEGTMPFYLRTNDVGENEYSVVGYRRTQTPQYQNSTTIEGDRVRTGKIQSNNFSTTAGSEYNLNDGTFTLGGSTNPDLSFDGTTLEVSGTLSSSIGNIGGFTINSSEIKSNNADGDTGLTLKAGGQITASNAKITGEINATTGVFSGSISASAGQVGGWTINASTLTGGNVTLDSTGFIKVGTLGDAGDTATTNKGFFADNTGNVLIKGDDNDTNYIKFDENAGKSALQIKTEAFELVDGNLEISGTLSSSRGNIGGWTLSDSVITNGPAQLGTIGDFTGLHINAINNYWYSSSIAGVHFRVGGTNDFIQFVGDSDFSTTSFEISSSNIHISGGNAVFSGSVTATDGKIGGWHLKTNEISASGGISLNSSTSGNSPHLSLGTKVTALSSNAGVFIGKSTFLGSDYGIAIGNTDVFSNDGGILMAAGLDNPSSNTIFAAGEIGNAYADTQGNASYFMYRPSSGIVIQHPNFMMRDGVLRISSSEANNTIIQLDSDGHTKGIDIKSKEGIIGHGDSTNRELTTHEGNFIFSENVVSIAAGGGGIGTDDDGEYELFGGGGSDDIQGPGGGFGGT